MIVRGGRGLARYVRRGIGRYGLGDDSGISDTVGLPPGSSIDIGGGTITIPGSSPSSPSVIVTSSPGSSGINWNSILGNLFQSGTQLGKMALLPSGSSLLPSGAVISPYGAAGGLLSAGGVGQLNLGTIFLYGAILVGGIALVSAIGKK